MKYRVCPYCGAHLDYGERCDCYEEKERGRENNQADNLERDNVPAGDGGNVSVAVRKRGNYRSLKTCAIICLAFFLMPRSAAAQMKAILSDLDDGSYLNHLYSQMYENLERAEKEKEWAELQPCVRYEQTASEETVLETESTEENMVQVVETPSQENSGNQAAAQMATTPLYTVNGAMLDPAIQEYLYTRLCEAGIGWFFPISLCIAYQESNFDIHAVNKSNGIDKGLFQFRSTYWGEGDIFDPYNQINVFVGLMANRANNLGCTESEMVSRHNTSDYGSYNQAYVDVVMRWTGSLVQVR